MTNCSVICDLLPLYVDHEASEETEALVRRHLSQCPDCREQYAEMSRITRSMKTPECGNHYQFSSLIRKIKRRYAAVLAVGAAVVLLVGYLAGKLSSGERG